MEDNEIGFSSMWTEQIAVRGCAIILFNKKFEGDYFFNKVSVAGCADPEKAVEEAAKVLSEKGLRCHLYVHNNEKLEKLLQKNGFAQVDTMHVLKSTQKGKASDRVRMDPNLTQMWIDVFCKSFGVEHWRPEVQRIITSNLDKLHLVLSYEGETPAGCGALYETNGLTGLYCLGTLPQFRGHGLAKSIVQSAMQEDFLFLQAFQSEGFLGFYKELGFRTAYCKSIYTFQLQ